MAEDIRQIKDECSKSSDYGNLWKKWFKRDNLIILVLAGILLFIIALPTKENSKGGTDGKVKLFDFGDETENRDNTDILNVNAGAMDAAGEVVEKDDRLMGYASEQEEKLKTLISAMEGVGRVEVMITLASSEELVVERDRTVTRSNTVEKDSEGGTRTVTQYEQGDTAVYKGSSGQSEPYVIKTNNPKVEGILVVAEGAADAEVNLRITESVQALYDVEAHKVKVVPLGN